PPRRRARSPSFSYLSASPHLLLPHRQPSLSSPPPPPRPLPRDPDPARGAATRPSDAEPGTTSSSDAAMRFEAVPPAPAGAAPNACTAAETRRTPVGAREVMARSPVPDPAHGRGQEQSCKPIPLGEGATKPGSAQGGNWDATRRIQQTVAASAVRARLSAPWPSSTASPVSQQTQLRALCQMHHQEPCGSSLGPFPPCSTFISVLGEDNVSSLWPC
ncbi:unnamed protein product, partial [Urochloa humidicola]